MEEEHYDTPWEYKNKFLNSLKSRPISSNILPSTSTFQNELRNQQHKSLLIHPNENNSSLSLPSNGKLLKRSQNLKDETKRRKSEHDDFSNNSNLGSDYPFVKNTTGKNRSVLSQVLLKKFNNFNENELIHENIGRSEAEQLLMPKSVGEFLLRKRQEGNLALSLKASEGVLHIKLEKRENNSWVLGEGPQFPSISGCLKYYYRTALPIRGSEHVLLRAPLLASPVH